jgi:hypothetical protein
VLLGFYRPTIVSWKAKNKNDSGRLVGAKLKELSGRVLSFMEDQLLDPEDNVRQHSAARCDCGVRYRHYASQMVFDVPLRTMVKRGEGPTWSIWPGVAPDLVHVELSAPRMRLSSAVYFVE